MKTQYEVFIDAVSCALEDHSFGTKWYFDFDEQTTVPALEGADFANGVDNEVDWDKLAMALNQRHPFSAFKEMLHYIGQREKWFAYKEKRMKEIGPIMRWFIKTTMPVAIAAVY